METPRRTRIPSYTRDRERHSHSISAVQEDILNISPRLLHYKPGIRLDRQMHTQSSLSNPQDVGMSRKSTSSLPSTAANTTKSVTDLLNEIATIEVEVVHLERHLLSLYRTTFDQYLTSSPATYSLALSSSNTSFDQSSVLAPVEKKRQYFTTKGDEPSAFTPKFMSHSPATHKHNSFSDSKTKLALTKSISGHRSLADHFGASITEHVTEISPHRLSEEIIKCISSVYCKLAKPALISQECDISAASCTPSVSSSNSSFSPMERCDNSWSPCRFESPKERTLGLYDNMIIVPFIRIDADRFGYASKMLQNFRSLIKRLEKIDPRKMTHEEQLSFWINIHNALVMHAYLAYGLRQNRMRSTHMILKAAYNVGGHSVNACSIEGSILRCQTHRPALWMHTLFSSRRKPTNANEGHHTYALDHPEPLAHFALCTGAVSDPPVRLYTAKQIYLELEVAKAEFVQASVVVKKQSKILLPRMLHYYGKDASLELYDIIEVVCKCMPESQQRKDMERICLRKRVDRHIEWLPYKSSFRYVVHRDLAQQ